MLTEELNKINKVLDDLIHIVIKDIEDVRLASHDNVFARKKAKEELIKCFGNHKSLIDNEIVKLSNDTEENQDINSMLNQEQSSLLDSFRIKLQDLQDKNQILARLVLSVCEFYNKLLEQMVPTESIGYSTNKLKSSTYFNLRG